MKVFRPSENPITGGYSSTHTGYDFAGNGLPDAVRAGMDGQIVDRVDIYDTNWRNTGKLTTRDYGNYIKILHTDGTSELHAHLRKGSAFFIGTKVTAGMIVARIGNTGNSTGPHLHSEYRDVNNKNTPVEFIQGGGGVANMYGGLDLSNPESMKPCVDLFNKWKNGGLVDKSEVEKLQQQIKDHKCPPAANPKHIQALKDIQLILNSL